MALMVLLMVFLSGFTGLVYQVTWQKYLSVYLGSHALSTSLTLSCFFLFLALGYSFFGRFGHLLSANRIKSYAYIEGLIGVYAIVSPQVFSKLYENWPSFPSDSPSHFFSSVGFAFLLTGFPTFLMGGTIPLLTQGLSEKLQESHKIHAWVYGLNTLGAFLGTLLTGFFILEYFGLGQSLNITGIINCLICVFLIVYCKLTGQNFEGYTPVQSSEKTKPQWRLLLIAFLSGVLAFGLESLCIRLAGISLGSSNYTYSVIVSSFIVLIAIGSIFAARANEENGLKWLLGTQFALLVALIFLSLLLPHMPNFFMKTRLMFATTEFTFGPFWMTVLVIFFLLLLFPVALMGMTLPLLFQQLKRQGLFLNQTAGQMYAFNSIGATAGAILLGYLAFFFLNAHQVFLVLIFVSALSCWLLYELPSSNLKGVKKYSPLILSIAFILIAPGWSDYYFVPSRFLTHTTPVRTNSDFNTFINNYTLEELAKDWKLLYSNWGVNTYTVVTERASGERSVFVNGKPDASTTGDRFTRAMTALIPLTLAKQNSDIFIIGLGSGMSTGIATSFVGNQKVRVCEIASGVIGALPFFEKWNFNLKDKMEKVEIINDDAYKVLKNESDTYDLIFSEPSNTWVTGVEKIYTREFLKQAAGKLRPHGIYSQWFPLFSMSKEAFLSILYNFKSTFEYVTLWSADGGATIILASHQPLSSSIKDLEEKSLKMKEIYDSVERESATDILFHQLLSDAAVTDLARTATLKHSLYHPTLAYESGRAMHSVKTADLEKVSEKIFINSNEDFNTSSEENPMMVSRAPDRLVWQDLVNELPESFFKKGNQFLLKLHPLSAGKLSLARSYRFKDDDGEKQKALTESLRQASAKIDQYHYLQKGSPSSPPPMVNEKSSLGAELFERFIYLKSMREPAKLDNVTSQVPAQCDSELPPCFKSKLDILRFKNKIDPEKFGLLRKQLKEPDAQKEIEGLYKAAVNSSSEDVL